MSRLENLDTVLCTRGTVLAAAVASAAAAPANCVTAIVYQMRVEDRYPMIFRYFQQ